MVVFGCIDRFQIVCEDVWVTLVAATFSRSQCHELTMGKEGTPAVIALVTARHRGHMLVLGQEWDDGDRHICMSSYVPLLYTGQQVRTHGSMLFVLLSPSEAISPNLRSLVRSNLCIEGPPKGGVLA